MSLEAGLVRGTSGLGDVLGLEGTYCGPLGTSLACGM